MIQSKILRFIIGVTMFFVGSSGYFTNTAVAADTTPPTVSITGVPNALNGTESFIATFTFSEDISGFDATDISNGLTNATAPSANFGVTTANRVYTARIFPDGNGDVSLGLLAGAVQDIAGNNNNASATHTAILDAAPTVTIDAPSALATYAPFTVTFTFNEDIVGFDISDISANLTKASASGFSTVTANRVYSVTITPDGTGVVVLFLAGGAVQDLVGLDNDRTSLTRIGLDTSAPFGSVYNLPTTHDGSTSFTASYAFNEDITGFDLSDVNAGLTGATASNFVETTANRVFTALITPNGTADIELTILANAAQDRVGHGNTAFATETVSYVQSLSPTVSLIGSLLENRGQLVMQNRSSRTRRLDRLNGRSAQIGQISGFGYSITSEFIPFSAHIGADQSSFSYSSRQSKASDDAIKVQGDLAVMMTELGVQPDQPLTMVEGGVTQDGVLSNSTTGQVAAHIQPTLEGYGYGTGGTAENDLSAPLEPFDFWIEGTHQKYDGLGSAGNFTMLHSGFDYLITPELLAGFGLQLDWMTASQSGGGQTEGFGYMVGPYATYKLSDKLYLDGSLLWGRADNSVSPVSGLNDNFSSERWLATAALVGDFNYEGYQVRPQIGLSYFKETTDGFTNGNNVAIPSLTFETGVLNFGPHISKEFDVGKGYRLKPEFGIEGIWIFASENTAAQYSGLSSTLAQKGLRARINGQVAVANNNGVSFNFGGSYDGIGDSDYEAWGLNVGLNIKW